MPETWLIIGASRGIGLEFAKQLILRGDQVIAVVRNPSTANDLWKLSGTQTRPGGLIIEQCDVTRESDIDAFTARMRKLVVGSGMRIDNVVLNAGILKYPNRATEISFAEFAMHLHTNTIGPIIIAQKIVNLSLEGSFSPTAATTDNNQTTNTTTYQATTTVTAASTIPLPPPPPPPPRKVIFISSDSGSTSLFREHEDGFGAYGASKVALNQMLRHMAAELKRRGGVFAQVCVLALHPGEVSTDMANIELGWEVEGIISPRESVSGMLEVIANKDESDTGTFWCWDGREHPW